MKKRMFGNKGSTFVWLDSPETIQLVTLVSSPDETIYLVW